MSVNKTLIIAHRGTHRDRGDENTLIAFQRAIAAGVDGLEVDVQLYGNRLILKHDQDGVVPADVATFGDFLALIATTQYQGLLLIELKGRVGAEQLYHELQVKQLPNAVMLQSFQELPLRKWRRLDANVPIGYLRHVLNMVSWRLWRDGIIQQVNLDYRYWYLAWLRPFGVKTYWWTPNTRGWTTLLRMLSVRGIITDIASKIL